LTCHQTNHNADGTVSNLRKPVFKPKGK